MPNRNGDTDSGTEQNRATMADPVPEPQQSLIRGSSVTDDGQRDDGDGARGKRDRSESGDSAPAEKKTAQSPSASAITRSLKDYMNDALERLENRINASLSRELHEFREVFQNQFEVFAEKLRDLEKHVEARDNVIDGLARDLQESREEVRALQTRQEEAEINSRLPCLILSGSVMASRHAPRRATPGPASGPPQRRPPDQPDQPDGSSSAPHAPQAGAPAAGHQQQDHQPAGGASRGGATRRTEQEEKEDVYALVINTINQLLPGVNMTSRDIDRAHRIPGPNNRVIVRFTHSGEGSVRDQVYGRRLELAGKDFYISESLTKLRGQLFRSLLLARRQKMLYTVYTRGGQVYFKAERYGYSERVDTLERVRRLGFPVAPR